MLRTFDARPEAAFPGSRARSAVRATLHLHQSSPGPAVENLFMKDLPTHVPNEISASVDEIARLRAVYGELTFDAVVVHAPADCWLRVCALREHREYAAALLCSGRDVTGVALGGAFGEGGLGWAGASGPPAKRARLCRPPDAPPSQALSGAASAGPRRRTLGFARRDLSCFRAVVDVCPVCLDDCSLTTFLRCGHGYCEKCAQKLRAWRTDRCPKCRGPAQEWARGAEREGWPAYVRALHGGREAEVVAFVGSEEDVAHAREAYESTVETLGLAPPGASEIIFVKPGRLCGRRRGATALVVLLAESARSAVRACEWHFDVARVDELCA